MTNAIRETITDSLIVIGVSTDEIENYNRWIDVAKDALVEREYEIAERIIEVALSETEFDREAIENFVAQAGLSVRPQPEPEPVVEAPAADLTDSERITKLEQNQQTIVDALNKLTRLAEQHLGSSSL